jgi:hypothetical protein
MEIDATLLFLLEMKRGAFTREIRIKPILPTGENIRNISHRLGFQSPAGWNLSGSIRLSLTPGQLSLFEYSLRCETCNTSENWLEQLRYSLTVPTNHSGFCLDFLPEVWGLIPG